MAGRVAAGIAGGRRGRAQVVHAPDPLEYLQRSTPEELERLADKARRNEQKRATELEQREKAAQALQDRKRERAEKKQEAAGSGKKTQKERREERKARDRAEK